MAQLIPEPSQTNPSTPDWQGLLSKLTKTTGGLLLCNLKNLDNDEEPSVLPGGRFEINGSYYEVLLEEYITGWNGILNNRTVYIYAVPGGSNASFVFDTAIPIFSPEKGGWFNGPSRALWRLYKNENGNYINKQIMMNHPFIVPIYDSDPANPVAGQIWIRGDL